MPKKSILTEQELMEILSNYELSYIEQLEEFEAGEENTNILVKTRNKKYVLRVYNFKRTEEQVTFELSLINHLFLNKFPVSKVFPNKNLSLLTKYKENFSVLFSFIEGENILSQDLNIQQLMSVARNLSRLHALLEDFSPAGLKEREDMFWFTMEYEIQRTVFPRIINDHEFKDIRTILLFLQEVLPPLERELNSYNKTARIGIVHNDFQDGNLKFNGDKVSGIFDFDDSCPGALISDVAIAVNNFCFDGLLLNKKKADIFLNTYQKNKNLKEREMEAIIPLMRHANSFSIHNAIRLWFLDRKNQKYYHSVITRSYGKLLYLEEMIK